MDEPAFLPDLRLHHLGYVVKDIEPIADMYRSRFAYQPHTPILHDPLQTAFVQFFARPGEAAYLEFVAPDGPASRLTNAAARRGGLHHLCYTCADLPASIATLEATGMRLILAPQPAVAFAGRHVCWLMGEDPVPIELVARRHDRDLCTPGII
jgi:methylmalonyl-CoA/ethylmalonyl-CoA epimerase